MDSELLKDLKAVIEKHETPEKSPVIRWIPVCDQYESASYCSVTKEKGGKTISQGKIVDRKVLYWVKVFIDPKSAFTAVRILDVVEP